MKMGSLNIKKFLNPKQSIIVGVTFFITSIGSGILLLYFIFKNKKLQAKDKNT